VEFIGVPAKEYVELEYRCELMEEGKIKFFGGKQELLYRGHLDTIDICMMIHSYDMTAIGKKVIVGPQGNGFLGKKVVFTGKEAHAGEAPHAGCMSSDLFGQSIRESKAQFLEPCIDHIQSTAS